MVGRGEIDDGKTVLLLQWAALQRRLRRRFGALDRLARLAPQRRAVAPRDVGRASMPGPLDGVKVVELGVWIAGPAAGGVLADWGADVVKIEPPEGDPARAVRQDARRRPAVQPGLRARQPRQAQRRARPRDRRRQGRRARPARRAPTCSSRTSAARRWRRLGLDDETLLARNPRLVYGHITGFGREGPDADKAAFDIAAFWSRAGIAHLLTAPGGKLPFQRGGMGDHNTGSTFAGGICAALFDRERTGRGPARLVVAVPPGRLHGRASTSTPSSAGAATRRSARRETMPSPSVNNYRAGLRPALLDRRPRGRPPLAADRPPRRPPGVDRRPALRHRRSTGRCTPPS